MSLVEQSWQAVAETLGFRTEDEMLKNLYVQQGFSLREIAEIIGYSLISVRRRLLQLGVAMRRRGGAINRQGRRRLRHVSSEDLFNTKPETLAVLNNVHIVTVFAEKRLRRKRNGVLSTSTDQVPDSLSNQGTQPHGSGSGSAEASELLRLLQRKDELG